MHMVEPNLTDKDRYTISFNMEVRYHGENAQQFDPVDFHLMNLYSKVRMIWVVL